jgi:hypothetical protein
MHKPSPMHIPVSLHNIHNAIHRFAPASLLLFPETKWSENVNNEVGEPLKQW